MKISQHWLLPCLTLIGSLGSVAAQTYSCANNADEGKLIVRNGKEYQIKCKQAVKGRPVATKPGRSAVECVEKCAADASCVHAAFVADENLCEFRKDADLFNYSDPDFPLVTWYYVRDVRAEPEPTTGHDDNTQETTVPDTGLGDNTQRPIADDTTSDAGSGNKASYTCPADEGERYTTNGVTYELRCNTGHSIGHWTGEDCPTLKECADRCARKPGCYSCDWERTAKTCQYKKAPSETSSWAPGDAWYPVQCPKNRVSQQIAKPEVTTSLTCPQNDGKIFKGSDGTWFYLQCCTDTDGASILGYETVNTHEECAEKCVVDKKCKSAMFVPGGDGSRPNCRLYEHGKFSTTKQEGAHYAFVTDPPTNDPVLSEAKLCSTECPEADGQLFVSHTGENFQMTCKKRHGTTYLKIDRRESFEACLTACAILPGCDSIDYEARTKKCFFSNDNNAPAIDAPAFASAHSLGCAGACASCKKGCDQAKRDKPLQADEATCDADHGKIISSGNEDFRLQCRHCIRHTPGASWKAERAANLDECARACAADSRCHGADWMGPNGGCWLVPARNPDGSAITFARDARCDALMPQSRSLPDFDNVIIDNPETTERDW
ncbi:PAN domain-containing protein [Phialemonium atrogriseum]|uniref:PAN domain-containing protein n=1 Tax=Phialemonium atrogriseum TaxID=1093897 RepID=A0AAJ0BVM8_9PEZI|nr:PAN domain-containing protein [Phialemonium atrogriseum]KAK1763882.1 PAN domain-containing protein [Phialemonium atrogriseum]